MHWVPNERMQPVKYSEVRIRNIAENRPASLASAFGSRDNAVKQFGSDFNEIVVLALFIFYVAMP